MRNIITFILFIASNLITAQIYVCKEGNTKFTSEAPLELIKAQSNKTSGVVDCATKNVAFSIDVSSFDGFNSELQKEHFLENYLETEKYPNATFKGKIIENVDFTKKGVINVRAKGILLIHGVSKEKIVKVQLTIKDKEIFTEAEFEVPLDEHNIRVPKVVNQKIASVITVEVKATLKPKA